MIKLLRMYTPRTALRTFGSSKGTFLATCIIPRMITMLVLKRQKRHVSISRPQDLNQHAIAAACSLLSRSPSHCLLCRLRGDGATVRRRYGEDNVHLRTETGHLDRCVLSRTSGRLRY